ncbi:hypothetical protein M8C21_031893, partial [Ambrosia artemisiifolia]
MSKRGKRGKRGVASFQKNYKEKDYKVDFDKNDRPVGAMSSPFMSWFGLRIRQMFPYQIDTKNFETNMWEELWLDAKRLWNIRRMGFAGLEAKVDAIWPQLEAKYPYLKTIQDKRSKAWIMSQKVKNPESKSYELAPDSHETIKRLVRTEREMIEDGSYFAGKDDPIVRVMGREHGGRTRAVSEVIGSTKKLTQCELLFPFQLSCEKMPVLEVTKTGDIKNVGDMLHSFVQWPRDALKIVNKEISSRSLSASRTTLSPGSSTYAGASPQTPTADVAATSCYHPEMEQDDPSELQMPIQQNIAQNAFMNMLMQVQELPQNVYQQQMQATHAPNPGPTQQMPSTHVPNHDTAFVDPEVTTALERTKTRPRAIQDVGCVGDNHSIELSSPAMMYPYTVRDSIPYVELLQLFSNDWLDITVIHGFAMYFYESHNSRCAFFNPHHIKGDSCTKDSEGVQAYIIDMLTFHTDKTFFVAPYLANNHWTLIIICPSTERGYIIDSIRREKDQHDYLLTSVIEEAFGFPFIWDMVKAKQQKNGWECGFMGYLSIP